MLIEITGVNTWNKGAELMLVAIRERFARHHPHVRLAVDHRFGTYQERTRYGLLQRRDVRRWGRVRIALALMPPSFRASVGLVTEEEVDVVLDASGFAFGDQHPAERILSFAERIERVAQRGKRVVLLPQALGPFENPVMREAFRRVAQAADLIFARDPVSCEHATRAAAGRGRIETAPDFTNLVKPFLGTASASSRVACIVPNQRMIEKAPTTAQADAYVPLMARCVEAVQAAGLEPVLLVHGAHDEPLAGEIGRAAGRALRTIREEDPVQIKRILGESHLVIGSRFHALVSALSQGVPSIATSWSHKYEMLLRDYGCETLILPVPADAAAIRERVDAAAGAGRAALVERIGTRGAVLIEETKAMWRRVDEVLGLKASVPAAEAA